MKRAALVVGVWALVALFFIGHNIVGVVTLGYELDAPNWLQQVGFELLYWTPYALLTPALLFMARRFRLEPGVWGRHLVLQALGGVTFALVQVSMFSALKYVLVTTVPISDRAFVDWALANIGATFPLLLITGVWRYWVIIGLYYAFDYYRRYRERQLRASQLEARLATSRLLTLKMQLQPHFLFNTLHSVSMLNLTDTEEANRVLTMLGELLRLTLDNTERQYVDLLSEVEFVERYLEIETVRFADRLRVDLRVDEGVYDAQVPNLILQPLVENAVQHGIAQSSTAGRLIISACAAGEKLVLEVTDDGPGLAPGFDIDRDEGMGLSNTRARLRHLYGTEHRFECSTPPTGGCTIRMTIPLRRAPAVGTNGVPSQ
jgi:signal transduction histidine kinase